LRQLWATAAQPEATTTAEHHHQARQQQQQHLNQAEEKEKQREAVLGLVDAALDQLRSGLLVELVPGREFQFRSGGGAPAKGGTAAVADGFWLDDHWRLTFGHNCSICLGRLHQPDGEEGSPRGHQPVKEMAKCKVRWGWE
jgi:hypothetical protein